MPTLLDYAVLSAVAYDDVRIGQNLVAIPTTEGWAQIGVVPSALGFAAVAYQNGNNIVISYEGTDTKRQGQVLQCNIHSDKRRGHKRRGQVLQCNIHSRFTSRKYVNARPDPVVCYRLDWHRRDKVGPLFGGPN